MTYAIQMAYHNLGSNYFFEPIKKFRRNTLALMSLTMLESNKLLSQYKSFSESQTFASRRPETLYNPIRYAMSAKGKAVRPLLLLLSHALSGRDTSEALPAAYAVELFHNFTLVHDDIMDDADLRRNQPTVHIKYGIPSAILSGDAMLIHTYGYLLNHYPGELGIKLLSHFQRMAEELCEGQQLDMDMEAGIEANFTDYLTMIHGKTGVLITTAMVMGGLIGGLDEQHCEKLKEAGDLAGRAFQIQDDILDTFSTSEKTGKTAYGDIVRGKQSAPYLKALELATDTQQSILKEVYSLSVDNRRSHITEVLEILRQLNVENILANEVKSLSEKASESLKLAGGNSLALNNLVSFTEALAQRTF